MIVISRRASTTQIALRVYASLRQSLPGVTIKPDTKSAIDTNDTAADAAAYLTGASLATLILVVGHDWQGTWLQDAQDVDYQVLRAALENHRPVIVLSHNGASLPQLPQELEPLSQALLIDLTDEGFYQSIALLVRSVEPLVSNGTTSATTVPNKTPASVEYPPNPHYPGSNRTIHKAISPASFQHPLDKLATENLRKAKGFDFLMAKFIEYGFEKLDHILYSANSILVTETQYPELYKMLIESCTILDMPVPELYVIQTGMVNAFTSGEVRPYIVIHSGLLDMMTDEEVMAVIAHELGHIKCKHVLYNMMARLGSPLLSEAAGVIPVFGDLLKMGVSIGLQIALLTWQRRSELSADRAALLVLQEPAPCISMLAKLAGGTFNNRHEINLSAFMEQARNYKVDDAGSNVDKFYRLLALMQQTTHPFPVERARYLNDWTDTPEFDQIMRGVYERQVVKA